MKYSVSVQEEDFDLAMECRALTATSAETEVTPGALATFSGYVRSDSRDDGVEVSHLWVEHYPAMTQSAIEQYCDIAAKRWPILRIRVVHRVGQLAVGDNIVFVGVASAHRKAAFQACDYVMDQLKTRAPFWKKAQLSNGDAQWIDVNNADVVSADAW